MVLDEGAAVGFQEEPHEPDESGEDGHEGDDKEPEPEKDVDLLVVHVDPQGAL